MDIFYITVLCVMVIVLILYLTVMGIKLSYSKNDNLNIKLQSCPDNWHSIMENNNKQWCVIPSSVNKGILTGDCSNVLPFTQSASSCKPINSNTAINFNDDKWIEHAGTSGLLLKDEWKRWANSNRITWNTITNN